MARAAWKAVLFDLDGTLYSYAICHRRALKTAGVVAKSELGLNTGEFIDLYEESRQTVHRRLLGTAGSHNRLLYFNELVFKCTGKTSVAVIKRLEKGYWSGFFRKMRLYPGVTRLLQKLGKCSVRLALVTDMTAAIQFEKIERLKLANMFDVVVTSEEAGCEKPDVKIFELCLRRLDLGSDSVICVGDDFERDAMGAQAAGLEFVLFMPKARPVAQYRCRIARSFSELTRILIPDSPNV